jgi:hypothetical protein
MAKLKEKGRIGAERKLILKFNEGYLDLEAEIGQGKFCSCINLKIWARKSPDGRGMAGELELCLSYYQAKILAEILENFVSSKNSHQRAQTPVMISWDGTHRWSTFGYRI